MICFKRIKRMSGSFSPPMERAPNTVALENKHYTMDSAYRKEIVLKNRTAAARKQLSHSANTQSGFRPRRFVGEIIPA
jgi:hypothetical protein